MMTSSLTTSLLCIVQQQSMSHHAHSHQSTVTTRPQSEATSLRAELGSGAASYVSGNASWAPASNTIPAFQQPQQPPQPPQSQQQPQQPQPQQQQSQQQQQWSQLTGQTLACPWSPLDNPNSNMSDLSVSFQRRFLTVTCAWLDIVHSIYYSHRSLLHFFYASSACPFPVDSSTSFTKTFS